MRCRLRLPRLLLKSPRWSFGTRRIQTGPITRRGRQSQSGPWTPELLKTTEKYPLSISLSTPSRKSAGRRWAGPRTEDPVYSASNQHYIRPQIVSEELCNDIIKYIGPTLEKHKGCDILDINPGAGLWSRKLHELLQPRNHVLLEPGPEMVDEFLKPLLEAPGSTYKLHVGEVGSKETYRRLVDDGAFPQQKRVGPGDLDCQHRNDSILVIGSLMWAPRLRGHGFDSMAKQLHMMFAQMAWKNEGIHAFGLARSLLWGMNEEFHNHLPRSAVRVSKYSLYMDTLGTMSEVVTPGHLKRLGRTIGREPQYELESIVRALQNGRNKGMIMPIHRRENVHDFAEDIERLTGGTGLMSYADIQGYMKEQEKAGKSTVGVNAEANIKVYQNEALEEADPNVFKQLDPGDARKSLNERGRLVAVRRATAKRNRGVHADAERLAIMEEDIYKVECKLVDMKDGPEKETVSKELQKLEDELAKGKNNIIRNYHATIESELDDRLALHSSAPRLQWDVRPYEPLVMQPDEAWPANRVSLIDHEPRPLPRGRAEDWWDWYQDFAGALFEGSQLSVWEALEKMQPGMSEITKNAPSLTDPKRGGRLNMKKLRVRMLTIEMVDELHTAYREWPFRSPDADHSRYFSLKTGAAKRMVALH